MIKTLRTDSANRDFIMLVKKLDRELAERDGSDHSFYAQFNKIDKIKYVVLAYENDQPIACGAMKEYMPPIVEIKRMYTLPENRGKGLASLVLSELEKWAAELQFQTCILETGKRQREAIALYKKNGYSVIPNYGQYAEVENSVCFQKEIRPDRQNQDVAPRYT
jgi:putative acetyltransferase